VPFLLSLSGSEMETFRTPPRRSRGKKPRPEFQFIMIRFLPKAASFAIELDAVAGSGSRVLVFDDQRALS
jgi:hypothetical protein